MKKRRFIEAIVFLVLVTGVLAVLTKITTNSGDYRNFQWIRGFYEEREDSLDAVYIGGSNVYAFWCAPVAWENYGITVYPFANNAQPLAAAKYLVEEGRKTQPDALYIISINNVFFDYSEAGIHYVLDFMPTSKVKFQLADALLDYGGYEPEDRLEFYLPLLRYHSRWNELTKNDFTYELNGLKGACTYGSYLKGSEDISASYRKTAKLGKLDGNVEQIINDLLDYCESEKVNVLFVTAPQGQGDVTTVAQYNTINSMIEERGFPTLDMTDMTDDIGLDLKKDYYNEHHVNIHGSVKVTDYLCRYLVENYHLADKRGDPAYSDWDQAFDKYVEATSPFALDFEYTNSRRDPALPAPELSGITVNGGNALTVAWKAVKGADGYSVFRREDGAGWQRIADVSADERSYRDENCWLAHKYTYTVAPYRVTEDGLCWGSYDFAGVAATEVLSAANAMEVFGDAGIPTVTWEAVPGADGYQLFHRVLGKNWVLVADMDKTIYADGAALEGVPYQYRVRAYSLNEAGGKVTGLYSYCLWRPEFSGPEVTAELADGVPLIRWKTMEGMTNYIVARRMAGGEWEQIAEPLAADCVQFRDITAQAGVSYEYQVTANIIYGEDINSYPSDPIAVTAEMGPMTLDPPEILFCEQVGNMVQLVWEPSVNATAYRIYRRAEGVDKWIIVKDAESGNIYSEKPPVAGTYVYAIQSLYTENGCIHYGAFQGNIEGKTVYFK